jgi:hypothetical protein
MNKKHIEDTNKMSDQEINHKIAEFCGWTNIEEEYIPSECDSKYKSRALYGNKLINTFITRKQIPNYTDDLNAIHRAENVLLNMGDEWGVYCDYLMDLIVGEEGYQAGELLIHASAKKRSLAFLTTITAIKGEKQ